MSSAVPSGRQARARGFARLAAALRLQRRAAMRRLLLVVAMLGGGCLVDLVPGHRDDNNRNQDIDGGLARDGGAADLAPAPDLAPKQCIDIVPAIADGHHNPGQNCMSCHNANNLAIPQFTVAGTLFDSATGGNPIAGATIEITDAMGMKHGLLTATNGNFYTEQPLPAPFASPRATGCPNNAVMPGLPTTGSCNSCHQSGSQIHLP
jgi:hypothetical protein